MASFIFVDWLVFVSLGILFLSLVALLILGYLKMSLPKLWLAAFLGTALTWPLIVLARLGIPHEIYVGFWQPGLLSDPSLFSSTPIFLLDNISWTFALAVSSLGLSVILTAVSRLDDGGWRTWFLTIAMTILGILAVLVGNFISVILIWTALDLVGFATLIAHTKDTDAQEQVFRNFGTRLTGTFVLIGITFLPNPHNINLSVLDISQQTIPFFILAAGLRLAVVPFQIPQSVERSLPKGVGTMLWLIPLAASLVLFVRISVIRVQHVWFLVMLSLTLIFFLYSTIRWLNAKDEVDGRSYWVASVASFTILAAILGETNASLIFGASGLFFGGLLFLSTIRNRGLYFLFVLAVLGLSMLPFSSTWQATSIFSSLLQQLPMVGAVFVISITMVCYSIFLFGFIQFSFRIQEMDRSTDRWIWLLYVPGLSLLLLTEIALGWIFLPDIRSQELLEWISGLVISGFVVGFHLLASKRLKWRNNGMGVSKFQFNILGNNFNPRWFYFLVGWLVKVSRNLLSIFNVVFEGEGGLLWSYLALIILISLAFQFGLVP